MFTEDEKRTAEAYRAFHESPEVQDILKTNLAGLTTVTEMAHALLLEWDYFKRLPENAGIEFYN